MSDLLTKLQASAPRPAADFAQQLEEQLVAELAQMSAAAHGDADRVAQATLSKPRRPFIHHTFASPLMLAAALLVVIAAAWLFGPMLWNGNGNVALGPTRQALAGYPMITAGNAQDLQRVDTLGNGAAFRAAYSPDGETLALAGTLGIWLYDTDDLSGQNRLLMSESPATAIAYNPDGALLASGHESGEIRLWSATSGQHVQTFSGHSDRVNALAFSPDGALLASASGSGSENEGSENTVRLWDVEAGSQLTVDPNYPFPVWSVAFSADGLLLASDSHLYTKFAVVGADVARTPQLLERFRPQAATPDSIFLSDGTLVANEGADIRIYVENQPPRATLALTDAPFFSDDGVVTVGVTEPQNAMVGHVTALAADVSSAFVVAGTASGSLHVVDMETHEVTTLREPDGAQVLSVAVSSAGQVVATFNTGEVSLYALDSGEAVSRIGDFDFAVTNVMAYGDNQLAYESLGGKLRLWDLESRVLLDTLPLGGSPMYHTSISPAGDAIIHSLSAPDGASHSYTYIRQLDDNTHVRFGHSVIDDSTFSHDGQLVAGVTQQWSLYVAEAETGAIRQVWGAYRDDYWFSPTFSPDDRWLAVGSPGKISIFNLEGSGHLATTFRLDDDVVVSGLWYSPDGKALLARTQSYTMEVVTESYTVLQLDTENMQLHLLDARTGDLIHDLTLPMSETSADLERTRQARFSPDGSLIATLTAVQFGTMRLDLWDVVTGERLDTPALEGLDVITVDFNTEGNLLVAGGWDGLVRLYAVTD